MSVCSVDRVLVGWSRGPHLGADSVAAACVNTLSCFLWAARTLLAAAGAVWLLCCGTKPLAGAVLLLTRGAARTRAAEWPVARACMLIMPVGVNAHGWAWRRGVRADREGGVEN